MAIELLKERQKVYLNVLSQGAPEAVARKKAGVTWREVKVWRVESDFSVAEREAKEDGEQAKADAFEVARYAAMANISQALSDGDWRATELFLTKADERFNPAQRHEVEGPKHRFIGFDGKDLHGEESGDEDGPEAISQEGS